MQSVVLASVQLTLYTFVSAFQEDKNCYLVLFTVIYWFLHTICIVSDSDQFQSFPVQPEDIILRQPHFVRYLVEVLSVQIPCAEDVFVCEVVDRMYCDSDVDQDRKSVV